MERILQVSCYHWIDDRVSVEAQNESRLLTELSLFLRDRKLLLSQHHKCTILKRPSFDFMKLICLKFDWLDWIHSIRDIFNVEMRAREISKRKKFYASNDTQQYCVPFYLATNAIRIKKYRNDFSSLSYLHYSYIYSNCAIFVASRRFYANYVGYSVVWTRTYRNLHERRIYMSWKPGNAREITALYLPTPFSFEFKLKICRRRNQRNQM